MNTWSTSSLLDESSIKLYFKNNILSVLSWRLCTKSWEVFHWHGTILKIMTMLIIPILSGYLTMMLRFYINLFVKQSISLESQLYTIWFQMKKHFSYKWKQERIYSKGIILHALYKHQRSDKLIFERILWVDST